MEAASRITVARGRPRAFDRDDALEKAMLLFWKRGYDATSVADLASGLGINPPSLYAAFGDKRSLFLEAVERYADRYGSFLPKALQEGATAYQAIERMLHDAAEMYSLPDCPRGCMVISAATNCTPASAGIADDLRARRVASHGAILARLKKGLGDGDLPDTADVGALADFYAATLYGLSALARDGASREALEGIAAQAMLIWPKQAAPESGVTGAR
jgi:TetR/AcrR family transcriptional regulator, copper-responsive repressor